MPRVNLNIPERVLELEKEIRGINGGAAYCTVADVCKLIGVKNYPVVYKLLGDISYLDVPGGHRRYRVREVAMQLYKQEVSA